MGPISKVAVSISGFAHTFPSDVGMLLVAPDGKTMSVLMNKSGDGDAVAGLNFTFNETSPTVVPQSSALSSTTYKPADYKPAPYNFPTGAPVGPYTANLNNFSNASPNGTWSLYVVDDTVGDAGVITNGWSLDIVTAPVIVGLQALTTLENVAGQESFTMVDDTLSTPTFTFSASSSDPSVVASSGVTFSGSGTNFVVMVNPVANASGSATVWSGYSGQRGWPDSNQQLCGHRDGGKLSPHAGSNSPQKHKRRHAG